MIRKATGKKTDMLKTIFDLCTPREDVLEGRLKDEEFVADLFTVVNHAAEPEYKIGIFHLAAPQARRNPYRRR